uniref:Proline rich 12 n=1 Tax=Poecilia latipinna TaxID=48699 RepID=A0A3B3U4A6_9TELE
MDRNYPGTGFGDLGAGAGWSYDRTAKSLVYGSSRSSHPDSELLHRQAYSTPHPLQGYATNHHPGSLSGLFDTGLHHASPSAPDASVMNLISALESRGPQPPPSASSLLSQFRTPSWQTAMHTPAPPELFISGALPGSGSFPSSSALSAYQHPASFSSRSFPAASLSLQETPTFSPTSNGLLSPHDPLIHIKAPSQSSLGFDRLLSSQGAAAAAAYRGSQDPTGASSAQASSARHLQSHQFNLLSSQLQDQSSQLYNPSVFSSAQPQPQSQSQSNSAQERAMPRQDSVIKHYQRPTPAQSQLSSSAAHSLQHYLSCGGAGYQQIATHHRHAGLPCSPLGDQSPSSDHKPAPRTEQYRPIIQPPYSSSSSSSSSSAGKGTKSSSSSGYSSGSSASSSRTPHTPPSASSTSSSSSSSSPPSTSTSAPQSLPKSCLSGYGSPVPPVKTPTSALTGQTPPQQQTQSYSPNQPPTSHLGQSYGGFNSPQAQDLSSGTAGKGYGSLGGRSHSYSTDLYGADSAYGSLPSSLGGAGSPSLGYGAPGHSPALLRSSGGNGGGSYHIPDSSPSPSGNSGIIRPGLHSPVPTCPTQSPGGAGSNKYIPSVLSPTFLASPQAYPDARGPSSQPQPYHSNSSKAKPDGSMMGVGSQRSQEEVDDDDEFLIQHLLQAQASPAPQAAHHHAQQQPQQASQQTQPQPQSGPPTSDSGKGMSYDMGKTPEERYHPQSVIRTHSATSSAGVGNTGSGGSISGLDNQLEMSLKKHGGGSGGSERHRQPQQEPQRQHPPHHQPQQSHHSAPELHSFLTEPDIGLSTPSHMHHLSQHHAQQQQTSQHHLPHPQQQPPHPHHIPPPSASAHPQNQPDPQQPLPSQLASQQSQLDQQRSDQHQFDTVSPVEKADQNQQSNRFVPLTSICFPDSLLQDEDRSFFPGMEDMFCAEDYKSSCAGGAGPGPEEMNESHPGQEGMDSMKAGQSAGGSAGSSGPGYDMMGHHGGDQAYEPYCHGLEEPSSNTMTLDLDSLKTHELPSTVNTEQLGLIQSQPPAMGMGSNPAGPNNAGAKLSSGPGGTGSGPGSGGLQSPIFCSSRPKKLLKSSSFHLLKERRDPNTLPKKSYAQEYEFEDDEDKADQPADIRLNSRRLPDLLPDLVSSCRKGGGGGSLSPLMGDIDFYHASGYSSMGSHSILPPDGPKKRGRKPTRPKREGPPRPRGRPRIRPMPEPYTPRGMMGEMGRGRGSRGRGGRREDMTDSLSGTDPALSDGSVGSAPSLGLSPGPPCSTESTRSQDKSKQKSQMINEKDSESKAGFVASFLDFLKTGKRPPGLDISPGMDHDNGETSPCKAGGLRPLSPAPPPPPPPPPFGDGEGNGGLALGNCPSPKRLEDELKRNLETLPSFSSDEEDSVGKNQDLQKSISSAISALYDTPQLTSNLQAPLPPPPPQPQAQPIQAPLTPTMEPPALTSVPPSPASSSSPSHSPLPPLSLPSPQPPQEEQQADSLPPSPAAPTSPSPPPPPEPAAVPQPATPPPASPPPPPPALPPPSSAQKESPMPSPESPASPEEPPAPKITSLHLAQKQEDRIFRERDEFVVRVEDIRTLKLALQTGREPPPIWRVQKALLQKFSPEIKDGQRQFCATSNYLGYFGDAKRRYQRIYVKFLENVNKKDYVRVCSRRPWRRSDKAEKRTQPQQDKAEKRTQPQQEKAEKRAQPQQERAEKRIHPQQEKAERRIQQQQEKVEKRAGAADRGRAKEDKKTLEKKEKEKAERPPKSKSTKVKAEPPPKKRKKWLNVPSSVPSSSDSDSSDEAASENEMPVKGGVDNRAMREMFRSYVEMLVSTALDPDMIQALEDTDDELYLPPMRKIDSILSEQKRRLLRKVSMSSQHQDVLHAYPQMMTDSLDTVVVRVRLTGDAYNRKTLNRVKKTLPKPQDLKLSSETYRIYSLYHSLHHYKYHTFLQCKKETNTIEQAAEDPGQEEVVQQCMANQSWLDTLFSSFIELLTLSTKA